MLQISQHLMMMINPVASVRMGRTPVISRDVSGYRDVSEVRRITDGRCIEMTDGIIHITFIVIAITIFGLLIGFIMGANSQCRYSHYHDFPCVEHLCPDPYSETCYERRCTIPDGTVIDDTIYSVFGNYSVDHIPPQYRWYITNNSVHYGTDPQYVWNETIIIDDRLNITFYELRNGTGCYENETGHDPDDLVMHMTCPEGVVP